MNSFGWKMALELLMNPFVLIILVLGFLSAIFYKKIVGFAGEFWVKQELKKLPKEYLVIHDVMLIVNSKSFQIDHIIVSKYGIFVIETKQYNGFLMGNDYDKNWTVKVGGRKYYIHNPVHQNYGHVQSLKKSLNLNEHLFIPIVCISSNASVHVKSDKVVLIANLLQTITNYKKEMLSDYKIIYNELLSLNITDKKKRKQHIKDVRQIIKQKDTDNSNRCPKCGNTLVERNGQYGKFIGCSNYPKCKFTKKY